MAYAAPDRSAPPAHSAARRARLRPYVVVVLGLVALLAVPTLGAVGGLSSVSSSSVWFFVFIFAGAALVTSHAAVAATFGLRPWSVALLVAATVATFFVAAPTAHRLILKSQGAQQTATVTHSERHSGRNGVLTFECALAHVEGTINCGIDTRAGDRLTVVADPHGLVEPVYPGSLASTGTYTAWLVTLAAGSTALVTVGTLRGGRRGPTS